MGRDNQIRYKLSLTALTLVACLVLSVGIAFGRFRTKLEPFEYWFESKSVAELSLWGVDENDNLTYLPSSWTLEPRGSVLLFGVTNGHAEEDLEFAVQVAVSGDVSNGSALEMTLFPAGDIESYTASVTQIKQGTQLYEEFGPGWIYRFLDEEGMELYWTLEGGQQSVFQAELLCEGSVTEENSGMLQLQVVAAP